MANDWARIFSLADAVGQKLLARDYFLASAESCTGGGVSYAVTEISGSSKWFVGGITAYSNQIKLNQLNVDAEILATAGAVSLPVVEAMALGVAKVMGSDVAVSTSGIAGPEGGSEEKPVGTVCFGWLIGDSMHSDTRHFSGDRESVRFQSIEHSLRILFERL